MAQSWFETLQRRFAPSGAGATTAIFTVQKGDRVVSLIARVDVAEVGSTTVEVGDGDDVDGYMIDTALTATGMQQGDGAYFSGQCGKAYAAQDTIDVKIVGTPSPQPVAVFEVVIEHTGL